VLTRDDPDLAALLMARGFSVVTLPCVRLEPVDRAALRAVLVTLAARDVLVLTSPAGVDAVADAIDLRAVPCPIAVVGRATAKRLHAHGRAADHIASAPTARRWRASFRCQAVRSSSRAPTVRSAIFPRRFARVALECAR